MAQAKKKDENELKAEAQAEQAELAEVEPTKAQLEQLGEGRSEEKDRMDKKPGKADKGPGFESDTPSAKALDKVGPPPEDAEPEELQAHGEAYQEEKRKHRWG